MKLIVSIVLVALITPTAFATPQEVSPTPLACQTYTDGDLEQALSCVNALNQIEKDRLQFNEDRTQALYDGIGLGTAIGAGIGMVAGNMTNTAGALSYAGLWELGKNSVKGAALGAGVGAVIGGGIMYAILPSPAGNVGPSPIDLDTAEGFELFLSMSSEAQIAFLIDYNPTNLINFLFETAAAVRDSALGQ